MPFSNQVKGELARHMPAQACCQVTELSTILRLEGNGRGTDTGWEVEVTLSNPAAARKAFLLFKQLLGSRRLDLQRVQRGAGRRAYVVRIPQATGAEMELLQAAKVGFGEADLALPKRLCCRRAILRATLLCRGSFADPERQNHLEIPVTPEAAAYVAKCLESLDIVPGLTQRKSGLVLYLKDGERIVELLKQVGAHNALLRLENVRIAKDVRNSVNRVINCETANVDKTVTAAMEQVEAIRKVDQTVGLATLSPKLQEAAQLRTQHPYATLQELAELTSPPISRSSVLYRLKRLMKIAEHLPE